MRQFIGLFVFCLVSSGATLTPYSLECEARHNPLGIDTAQPRLSWKLRSERRGDEQAAYRIVAASSSNKLTDGSFDFWDSGRVTSPESIWLPYGGRTLHSFQQVWWKVQVWSVLGEAAWSEPAQWTMTVLSESDRAGKWISTSSHALRSGPMPIFRRDFAYNRPVRRAMLLVSGLGFAEVRINGEKAGGEKAGDDVLAPAWTNYRKTVFYESYDVTPLLKTGPNAIGVMLGNGFFNVVGGRYSKYKGSFGVPRLWLQLHIEFDGGNQVDIGSDETWRVHDGPITFSDTYGGEDFDARKEPSGWDRTSFDASSWEHAAPVEAPGGRLTADFSPPVRVRETFSPVRVTEPKPGMFVYDLGQNFAGWPSITVSGRAGASIRLTCGELLDSEGLVSQRSQADAPSYFTYTLKGISNESWAPRFSYWGFRYVQVQGGAPEEKHRSDTPAIHKLEGQFVYLDIKQTGRFSSSDELLNRIHSLIVAAMKSNLQHVITDCPHREKLGWLEQDYLMGPSLLYNWDLRTLLPKVIRDTREAQLASGLVPDIAPEYPVFSEGFRDSPEWGSAAIILPWLAREWYGDMQPLRNNYGAMKQYAAYLTKRATDGVLRFGLGDWYDIGPGQPGPSKLTPTGLTATATWIWDLQILSHTAQLLNRSSDAQAFASQLALEKVAFQRAFFNESSLTYGTGSQTALAMPLQIGIAKPQDRLALAETLAGEVRRAGNHTTAGDIGYRYVIEALMDSGRNDLLFDMATEKSAPSYAGQIVAGATALTEAWDANPADSQNHLMLGHIEEWFYGGLAGIRLDPDSPGLTHVNIDPQPVGDLQSVGASWDTVRGPISVNWHIDNGTFTMSLDLPPGVSANLTLPASSPDQVWIAGRLASQDSDLQLLRGTQKVSYAIKSGKYEIAVKNFSSR